MATSVASALNALAHDALAGVDGTLSFIVDYFGDPSVDEYDSGNHE